MDELQEIEEFSRLWSQRAMQVEKTGQPLTDMTEYNDAMEDAVGLMEGASKADEARARELMTKTMIDIDFCFGLSGLRGDKK